jgi:uncharacterized protein YndB with AHSA1/START domain
MKEAVSSSCDLEQGSIDAVVEIAAPPERVFQALASEEIVNWWVNPGVFDTREWEGDLRVGGRWRASGISRGKPYVLEGEFLEVNPPRKLAHTWHLVGFEGMPHTTVTYVLDRIEGGTRVTLRHSGFASPGLCTANRIGWETSFQQLLRLFGELNEHG